MADALKCPHCGRPFGSPPVRVCWTCKRPIGRGHKWRFRDDGRIEHRVCNDPEAYIAGKHK